MIKRNQVSSSRRREIQSPNIFTGRQECQLILLEDFVLVYRIQQNFQLKDGFPFRGPKRLPTKMELETPKLLVRYVLNIVKKYNSLMKRKSEASEKAISVKLAKVFSNSKKSKNRCIDLPSKLFSPTSILQVHADDTTAGNYWTFLCLSVPFPCVLRHFSSLITELKSIPQCVPFNMCNFRQSNVGWSF